MSQENVELVRRQYELMDRGDLAAAMERIAPDFELDLSSLYPDAPILRGLDELLRWFYSGPWGGSARLEAERFFDVDAERVLVFVRVTATGEGSGVPVKLRDAHELTIRDGLLVRCKVHENVEVVRAFIEALNERGIQAAAAEFAAEEIEFREPPEQPGARVARGRDAAVEYFAGFDAAWDEHRSEPEEIRALDAERVLLLSVEHFRGRDGIQIDHSAGTIFTLMRGQIVLVQAFWERETALEAAGLQE